MLFTEVGVPLVPKEKECVDNIELNCFEEEERTRTMPMVAFDCCFMTQENADTFPILMCRDSRIGQMGATCCERKGTTAYSTSFLVGFIKDIGFRRIILKCDDEQSKKSLQDAVIQVCAGVEVSTVIWRVAHVKWNRMKNVVQSCAHRGLTGVLCFVPSLRSTVNQPASPGRLCSVNSLGLWC